MALTLPVFLALWAWHAAGFAAVLRVGRQPLWPALIQGSAMAAVTLGIVAAERADAGALAAAPLLAVTLAVAFSFHRALVRSLRASPLKDTYLRLERGAVICVVPVLGPAFAFVVALVVWLIRRRDRLDLWD